MVLSACLLTYFLPLLCSSSLDALDADSARDGHSEHAHVCCTSQSHGSSRTGTPAGEELDSFESNTLPDFHISRTESLSLSSHLQPKVFLLVSFLSSVENLLSKSIHLRVRDKLCFMQAFESFLG